MNRLLYVNIGGVVFQIDESAYNKLDMYLSSIRKKYASQPDGDEIIKDVENRIAELFHEKVGERGAITMQYVDEIITIMGKPEDYDETSEQQKTTSEQSDTSVHQSTKFYRDKENNILGGVCAGFAAKFDIAALWIRLGFLIAFLFFGTGLLLYIILWVIIPEAKTTTEKIEMRGDKVDINNIEKTVKETAGQFKDRIKDLGNEMKETFWKKQVEKTKKNAGDFIESAVKTVSPFFKGVAKVLFLGILIICLVIIVVIGGEIMSDWGENFRQISFLGDHIMQDSNRAWILVTCSLALFVIPIIGLMVSALKFVFEIKKKTKFIGRSLLFIWLVCLVAVIYLGITLGQQFKYQANVSSKTIIEQPHGNVMHIEMSDTASEHIVWHTTVHEHFGLINIDNDSLIFKQIHISFEKSTDTDYAVIVNKTARGFDRDDAKQNAENFDFTVKQSGDSIMLIPSSVLLKDGEVWRDEEADILIRVPQDKYVELDPKLRDYIDDNEYTSGLKDAELFGQKLKMTGSGLKPAY